MLPARPRPHNTAILIQNSSRPQPQLYKVCILVAGLLPRGRHAGLRGVATARGAALNSCGDQWSLTVVFWATARCAGYAALRGGATAGCATSNSCGIRRSAPGGVRQVPMGRLLWGAQHVHIWLPLRGAGDHPYGSGYSSLHMGIATFVKQPDCSSIHR